MTLETTRKSTDNPVVIDKQPDATEAPQHKSLAAAMVAVMGDIKRLQHAAENKHGKYSYTPIDDVKDALRPLLVKHGLMLNVSECAPVEIKDVPSKNGTTTTMFASYFVRVEYCQTGEYCTDTITVVLPYVGAQTAGIARSYAVKEWAKATLLLSTGEVFEADDTKPEHYGTAKEFDPDRVPVKKAREIFDGLLADMRTFTEIDKLDHWWNTATIGERIRALKGSWKKQAFIEYMIYGCSIAEDTAAVRSFKKAYEDPMKQLSEEELLTIDDGVENAKAGNANGTQS